MAKFTHAAPSSLCWAALEVDAEIPLSGMSSKARGVSETDLQGKPAEFAMPNILIRLSLDHDRTFTY